MTCKKHTGTKDAHETVVCAHEKICHDSGLSNERHNIPSVEKDNDE